MSIILNAVLFLLFMLSGKSFLAFADILFHISQLAIICSLAASGWLLTQAYHKTTIEHTRRQIRVIAVSCLSVMLLWVLLAVLPEMLFGRPAIPPHLLTMSFGLVPLAYLVSVRLDDLYRLDRLTLRFVGHLLATTCLGTLLVLASYILRLDGTTAVIWFAALGRR